MSEELENMGWDNIVERYEQEFGADEYTKQYWSAYDHMIDYDYDGYKCGEIRAKAMDKIYARLEKHYNNKEKNNE